MLHMVDEELIGICREIVSENRTSDEWALVESGDMFQTRKYCGGYDADESAFCFSVYRDDGEYWFQLSLDEAGRVLRGETISIQARIPD